MDWHRTVVQALSTSSLDYGNTLFAGLADFLSMRLQVIQNAAAKLICNKDRYSSASVCLKMLHCLPLLKRTRFKLLYHTHKALYNLCPAILRSKVKF